LAKWKSALEGLAVNPDFWQGKRVFLTGHTGFKGSWLSLWLQSLGSEVTGYSLSPPTSPNLFEVAGVAKGMTSIISDIRDLPTLQKAMQTASPDIVIHMAAQALVRQSYTEPVETYATNVMGTVHVLESARHTPSVKALLVVTTDKCYENKEEMHKSYHEHEPMGGHDPYSSSKACAELVTAAYRKSFLEHQSIAVATARAGNVIGGGDWAADRLVPDILHAFERNSVVQIRNPHATRPWQHVLEPLSGYLTLAEHLFSKGSTYSEGWNFGPHEDDAMPVQWIVEQLAMSWGNQASWQLDPGQHPHEANYLKLDISKAKLQLEWSPSWNLQTALQNITQWHRAWLNQENMKKLCLDQILQYSIAMQTKAL
jgi:CDP-glucose 4,6-dehydratase